MSKSTECSNLIVTEKENYQKEMAKKLDNRLSLYIPPAPLPHPPPPKKKILVNTNLFGKKHPNISPLIVNDFVVSDFITKANLFNNFFISQFSSVVNSSEPPKFSYKTKKRISDF